MRSQSTIGVNNILYGAQLTGNDTHKVFGVIINKVGNSVFFIGVSGMYKLASFYVGTTEMPLNCNQRKGI